MGNPTDCLNDGEGASRKGEVEDLERKAVLRRCPGWDGSRTLYSHCHIVITIVESQGGEFGSRGLRGFCLTAAIFSEKVEVRGFSE